MEKKQNTAYWQKQYNAKKVTLVDQEPKKGLELSTVWKVMKRLALHTQDKELPTVRKTVKGFALCVPCQRVVSYSTSTNTLCGYVHTAKCKVDPVVKATVPNPKD